MDKKKIGNEFENIGVEILKSKGFNIKKVTKNGEPYDVEIEVNGKQILVEIKGRSKGSKLERNFCINKNKITNLIDLNKEVWFLLINEYGNIIITLKELIDKKKFSIGNKRIYIGINRKENYYEKNKGLKFIQLGEKENIMLDKLKEKLNINKKEIVNKLIKESYNKIIN